MKEAFTQFAYFWDCHYTGKIDDWLTTHGNYNHDQNDNDNNGDHAHRGHCI